MKINDLEYFIRNRKEQYECAKEIRCLFDKARAIALKAKVKSGKLEVAIITKLLSLTGNQIVNEEHFFITSFNRRDCHIQMSECQQHGITCCILKNKLNVAEAINKIEHALSLDHVNKIVVTFDESDFGSGDEQLFKKVWDSVKNNPKIETVHHSATNEEIIFSNANPNSISFVPHPDYRGANWFLDNDLVEEAEAFFIGDHLSAQGKRAMNLLMNSPNNNFGVVRILELEKFKASKDKIEENIKIMFPNFSKIIIVDELNKFDWGKETPNSWGCYVLSNEKILLVVCQTCTRSTKVGFHKYISFWHEYRKKSSYATRAQAAFRVFHYDAVGIPIKVYALKDAFKLEAGRIAFNQYNENLSGRVKKGKTKHLRFDYHIEIVDSKPDADSIKNLLTTKNISCVSTGFKPKFRTISGSNKDDMCRSYLNGASHSTPYKGGIVAYHMDSPNNNHIDSWNEMVKINPNIKGKYALFIPTNVRIVDDYKVVNSAYN